MMYMLIKHSLLILLRLFYRVRSTGEESPKEGPVIFVANHPNGLLDPLMVLTVSSREIRFLSKEPLFRMFGVGALLRFAKALPVYRKQDGYSGSENATMFQAVSQALQSGDSICLFPEGVSHSSPQLLPLKTGAARMALEAEAGADFSLDVQIVPVGIYLSKKERFRSEATSVVGAPLIVGSRWRARYTEDPRSAVRELTKEISEAIQGVTVNLSSWSDLPVMQLVTELYSGETFETHDPVEKLGMISRAHESFVQVIPKRVHKLRQRIAHFGLMLNHVQLTPKSLDQKISLFSALWFALRHLTALVIGAPFALLGTLIFIVPYQGVRLFVALKDVESDVVATFKLIAGLIFYMFWWILCVGGVCFFGGALWGLGASLLIPLLGVHTLLFLEGRSTAWDQALLWIRTLILPRKALLKERELIKAEINALSAIYASELADSSSPQDSPERTHPSDFS